MSEIDPDLMKLFTKDKRVQTISKVTKGADAKFITELASKKNGLFVYLACNDVEAKLFKTHCHFFSSDCKILALPAWDCLPYDRISPSSYIAAQRISVLSELQHLKKEGIKTSVILIATIASMTQYCVPSEKIEATGFLIKKGENIDLDRLSEYFSIHGYQKTNLVADPGDYALRGGIIDVFSPVEKRPVRIDLFGRKVESIRIFDIETQRSQETREQFHLRPVSEIILNEKTISTFRASYVRNFGAGHNKDQQYETVITQMRFQGIEHWLPLFYEKTETIFDYLPESSCLFIEPLAEDALKERYEMIRDCYQARLSGFNKINSKIVSKNHFLLPPEQLYLMENTWSSNLLKFPLYYLSPFQTLKADLDLGTSQGKAFLLERQKKEGNIFEEVIRHIETHQKSRKRILIACWSEGSCERLEHIFKDHGLGRTRFIKHWSENRKFNFKDTFFSVLPLEKGFETSDMIVISEQDILGDKLSRPKSARRKAKNVIQTVSALRVGDLIIHLDHGLGRYRGLKTLKVQQHIHDYIELEYAGKDKLFLPVENLDLLGRYGASEEDKNLDKLGGVTWQARKSRVKKRLRDLAEYLIKTAAERQIKSIEKLLPPEPSYSEFCARFPYPETEDQLQAIEEVLGDLKKGYPMDRLICGDVGFGKTEIALRAAFILASAGYQIALVTPTTLLSRQHFKTFLDRFQGSSIEICQLSRLVNARQTKIIKEKIENGFYRIIIGTHAVLSKTIKFQNLGLVIIDEEQHFGVKHKEQLKNFRTHTHILTLTATPIPRTLQMSLSGLRDLSIITTPPVDRLSVRTYITDFDKVTVREALLREKYRGGQSFFIVPRISDLEEIQTFLINFVPEIRLGVAHGKMGGIKLEEIMTRFCDAEYDVLLSTSIIESGIDIPSANTVLIHKAEKFGLSQLYQMRGRVGRSKIRAYAYLMTSPGRKLTESAYKRLQALQSLTALGSGFSIASYDLDQRGGGNLLGEEQSGQIREVGIELYHTMLEEAVTALQKTEQEEEKIYRGSPQINLQANILIPETYIPDIDLRLSFYRQAALLETDEEGEALAAELIDRFGSLPEEVLNLIEVVRLKVLCKMLYISKIDAGEKGAVLRLWDHHPFDPEILLKIVGADPTMKVRADSSIFIERNWKIVGEQLKGVRNILETLLEKLL